MASAAAFLAVIAIAILVVVSAGSSGGDTSIDKTAEVKKLLSGIPQSGLTLGDPGAKPVLVEFGDLQCPVCRGYAEDQLATLIETRVHTGAARIEFRNFAILGEESELAGAAAIAAGAQGRGWQFIELFYRNQGLEDSGYVTDAFMTAVARAAGVPDIKKWDLMRHRAATLAEVRSTTEEAESLGFSGTPSFAVGRGAGVLRPIGTPNSPDELISALNSVS